VEATGKDPHSIDVGQRLRVLRAERGVSMRALARRSGLSANALSMIERGLTSPSVSTLHKLAGALEVPITAFFRQEPPRSKIVYRKADDRVCVKLVKGTWEGLGGESFTGRIEPFMITLEQGGSSGESGMIHTGHEFVYCLEGRLEYIVDEEHFDLEAGDSLIFAAQLQHRWSNPDEKTAKVIIVLAGFEESERPSEFHMTPASLDDEEDEDIVNEETAKELGGS